jgi:hypothetical protein
VAEKDVFAERGRSLEEEYFRKKDRELIEKMKKAAAGEQSRREMGERTGLTDPEMLRDLEELGFTPDTVSLLPLVPVLQVAWAEGGVTNVERKMLNDLARARGIGAGSAADRQLQDWMANQPDEAVFARAGRLIRAMLDAGQGQEQGRLTADDLVKYCEDIASVSGGFLGLGRISTEEREILASIASELKTRHG